ncbi:MAG TPA: peptidoglycan-binding protein [Xanthomonadaceae bacterium]
MSTPEQRKEFIDALYPAAVRVSRETGMSWELILAQAAQETGWGQRVLPGTNNLFNIKANGGWEGESRVFNVPEERNGRIVMEDHPFRVYESYDDALRDRVRFLQENPRYAAAGLFEPGTLGDPRREADALQRAGYATDSAYADNLMRVLQGPAMRTAIADAREANPGLEDGTMPGHTTSDAPRRAASAMADNVLRPGESGPEVRELQLALRDRGFDLNGTGNYRDRTEAAVREFQRREDLTIDGLAGPETLRALGLDNLIRDRPAAERPADTAAQGRNADVFNAAERYFLGNPTDWEYGRGDRSWANPSEGGNGRTDASRTEGDIDGDGRRGVDCSTFIWRGLHEAGFDVQGRFGSQGDFSTHDLFNGRNVTPEAREAFDVIGATEARQPNGNLQPGDILMWRSVGGSGQHVGVFGGYDDQGRITFIGSQIRTGPGQETVAPGGYWDGGTMEIMGALRPREDFRRQSMEPPTPSSADPSARPVRDPQEFAPISAADRSTTPAPAASAPATSDAMADGVLRRNEHGPAVGHHQRLLADLGYVGADGKPIAVDEKFGANTEFATRQFQRDHGIEQLGVIGPKTRAALESAGSALVTHPDNPNNALYQRTLEKVHAAEEARGIPHGEHSRKVAAALTVEAIREGIQPDKVELSKDGSLVRAVQFSAMGDRPELNRGTDPIATGQAANQPIRESSEQVAQVANNVAAQQRDQEFARQQSPQDTTLSVRAR